MSKSLPGRTLTYILIASALFAAYLVTHPYRGVQGDALIYVTRAWAPPAILDGDMLFAFERQTNYTLYSQILRALIGVMPVGDAARLLALLGVAVWFGALVLFARAMARAAGLSAASSLAMCALVALAPLGYSAGSSFAAGEFLAVPRPFAEAFVMLAFAAMLDGRAMLGVVALIAAAAFHPLMALAGAGVAFAWAALADRRLWLIAVAGCALALAAAAAGAPLVSGLLTSFDADWLALLRARTSYLFLTQAPASFWTDGLLRAAILFLALRRSDGRMRTFLLAVLVASAIGVGLSLACADLWPSVLVSQLQPWRVLFVATLVAPMAVVIVARSGAGARLLSLLLACAFMTRDAPLVSAVFSLAALVVDVDRRLALRASPAMEKALWAVAAAAWIAFDLANLVAFGTMLRDIPRDLAPPWSYLWVLRPLALPLSVLVLLAAARDRLPRAPVAACAAVIACGLAMLRFDDRAPVDRSLEAGRAQALAAAMPGGDASVLWLGQGKEAWYWLGRPNWVAPVQASSIVFSRDLARLWTERMRFLIGLNVLGAEVLANGASTAPHGVPADAVTAICGRADAPAAIVAPLAPDDVTPSGAQRILTPAPSYPLQAGEGLRFGKIEAVAVWTCGRLPTR